MRLNDVAPDLPMSPHTLLVACLKPVLHDASVPECAMHAPDISVANSQASQHSGFTGPG